jgi:hypothetical protein
MQGGHAASLSDPDEQSAVLNSFARPFIGLAVKIVITH